MQTGRVSFTAFEPSITHVDIDVGTELYRHVPSIAGKPRGELIGAYLYNDTSPLESDPGQRACFVRSVDFGKTWTPKVEELNEAWYCRAPLNPDADAAVQGEIFVHFDAIANQEIAVVAHRGSAFNAGFCAFREAKRGKLWQVGRFCWNDNNQPVLIEDVLFGPPPKDHKLTFTIDGVEHDCIPFKPVTIEDKLVIPTMFVRGFGVRHRVGFLVREAGAWTVSGLVPLGDVEPGSAWEPTTWQAEDGTWYCQARNNAERGAPSFDNHLIARSSDLKSWTEFAFLAEDIHLNRVMKYRFGDRWLGVGTSSDRHRNGVSLFASADGVNWVHGVQISNEEDGVDWASYSEMCEVEDQLCVLFSVKKDHQRTLGTNEIRFARFAAPSALPVMPSKKNLIETNVGRSPYVSGQRLIVPEEALGSIPAFGSSHTMSLRFRATGYTGEDRLNVLGIGNEIDGYVKLELRRYGLSLALFVDDSYVAPMIDPAVFRQVDIGFDRPAGQLKLFGRVFPISGQPRVYLGAVEGQTPDGSHEAVLEFDVLSMAMRRSITFEGDVPAAQRVTGGNVVQVEAIRALDLICFRHYGRQAGVVERVLEHNPHIKDTAHRLPVGALITLPEISAQQPTDQTVRLWT